MGCAGTKPILQVGGVQDAVMVVPPGRRLETAPLELTVATVGLLDVQVREVWEIGSALFVVSIAVDPIVEFVPLAAIIVVPPMPFTANLICWAGDVVKMNGTLVVFAMEAKI